MEIFRCQNRNEWREWLENNFTSKKEIWFVFPNKDADDHSISYNDAVEEALCFGWIDGRAGTLDKYHSIRRFTPRRKGSSYSQPNIERLLWLRDNKLLHPSVLESVQNILDKSFIIPKDILLKIKENPLAYQHFISFSPSYQRIRIAYIDSARNRPDEFKKRLNNFIEKTENNKIINGYGGIEKYYK